ncbi:MAG: hypothetical protein V1644_02070 [Candidatus Micrarchaeota archaeon]
MLKATVARGLRGRHKTAFRDVAELRKPKLTEKQEREFREKMFEIGKTLAFAFRIDPDKLTGLTDDEKHVITHKLGSNV